MLYNQERNPQIERPTPNMWNELVRDSLVELSSKISASKIKELTNMWNGYVL